MSAAIEQARARGLTLEETAAELNVPAGDVQTVWDRMDELAVEHDVAISLVAREQLELGPGSRLLEPHGTHAAFARHKNRDEVPCPSCRVGERIYNTERKRQRRIERAGAA